MPRKGYTEFNGVDGGELEVVSHGSDKPLVIVANEPTPLFSYYHNSPVRVDLSPDEAVRLRDLLNELYPEKPDGA